LKHFIISLLFLQPLLLYGQRERVKNDPTHDDKLLHFGFSVGMNTMDFNVRNSQLAFDSGIYTEVSVLRPGFHVHAISNLRISEYFDFRFTPGIAFGGQREVNYLLIGENNNAISQEDIPVIIESNFIEFPLLIKYKSVRLNNFRPFLIGGFNTRIDLSTTKKTWGRSSKEDNLLLLKPIDFYYEIGAGMDFYLAYFKLGLEFKYSVGLTDVLRRRIDRKGEIIIPSEEDAIFTNVIDRLMSRMFLITLHFE